MGHLDGRLAEHGAGGGREAADRQQGMARERAAVGGELLPVEAHLEGELLGRAGRQRARHRLGRGVVRRGHAHLAEHVLAVVRLPHEAARLGLRRHVAAAEGARPQRAASRAALRVG